MKDYIQKVIHLELDGKHYYFGSSKALCDTFSSDIIGINYEQIRRVKLAPDNPYKNDKCIIRKGFLVTTPKKRSDNNKNEEQEP